MYTLAKLPLSAGLVVLICELAKRNRWLGALLATLPLTALLAIVWLYVDTRDIERIATPSTEIFWLVLSSLSFSIALPWVLRMRVNFWPGMTVALVIMVACYQSVMALLKKIGVQP